MIFSIIKEYFPSKLNKKYYFELDKSLRGDFVKKYYLLYRKKIDVMLLH